MEVITTLDALDRKLVELDAAAAVSDAELRRAFQTFEMKSPAVEGHPDSDAYAKMQFDLYRTISGRQYSTDNEVTPFEPVKMAAKPFPYLNDNAEVTGDQLIAIGWIIKNLNLSKGATVLEFGPGWGNTTLALARNGAQVTAIEIEANFVALIEEQARRIPVDVEVIKGDFLDSIALKRSFDCVLFFECFHHCSRHNELLDALDDLVNPNGVVAFAAEPITEDFPAPWGLRLDGQSLWAIRKNGWLELGFQESYFYRSLLRRGWLVSKRVLPSCPLAVLYLARRAEGGVYPMATFDLPPDEDMTWALREADPNLQWRYAGEASRLTIQSCSLGQSIQLDMSNTAPFALAVEVRHGASTIKAEIGAHSDRLIELPADVAAQLLEVRSQTWNPDHTLASGDDRVIGVGVRAIRVVGP